MKKVLLLLLFSHALLAQPAYHFDLLKDINSRTNDAFIDFLENIGNTAVFFHNDGDINTGEPIFRFWKSNGTTMENFAFSDQLSFIPAYHKPTIIDDYIFFLVSANGSNNGLYLAKLDSPEIKKITNMVKDPIVVKFNNEFYYGYNSDLDEGKLYHYNPITNESTEIQGRDFSFFNPKKLTVANDKLFFKGSTGEWGNYRFYLWKSDGTSSGTYVVKEINIDYMSNIGNRAIFNGFENGNSYLYISDGTAAGTYPFKNIRSFGTHSGESVSIHGLYSFGDKALVLLDVNYNYQIWITDGTDVNTRFIGNYKAIGLFKDTEIALKDGFMYFVNGSGQLLKSNGVTTTALNNNSLFSTYGASFKMTYNLTDNNLYFSFGTKIYKTDGTSAGTQLLSDKLSGSTTENTAFAIASGKILAYTTPSTDSKFGKEIYEVRSDTIRILNDLNTTTKSADVKFILNAQEKTYFYAYENHNKKLFETDGTQEGTRSATRSANGYNEHYIELNGYIYLLADNQMQRVNFSTQSYETLKTFPQYLTPVKPVWSANKFYFILGNSPIELWVSDGTASGTKKISEFAEPDIFHSFVVNNQQLYVFTSDGTTTKLWKYPNDTTPPILVKTLDSSPVTRIVNFRNKLLFTRYTPDGLALWATDGTSNGTTQLDIFPFELNLYPERIYFTDNYYYYPIYTNNHIEVWKSDGTPSGTVMIADITDSDSGIKEFCECNNEVFFAIDRTEDFSKTFLYKYSLASNTTNLVTKVGRISYPTIKSFYCLSRQLYFPALGEGIEYDKAFLFTSDGTSVGTKKLLSLENKIRYYRYERGGNLYPLNNHELLIKTNDKMYDIEWFTFRKCEPVLTNLDGIATDSKIQTSPAFIESTEKITAENKVYYYAPKSITLNAGFTANSQSVFKAEIKNRPCTLRQ